MLFINRVRPIARLVQQFVRRFPWNLRSLLLVPRERNPKGLALCLSAMCRLPDQERSKCDAEELVRYLLKDRSPGRDLHCWGYNFRWESRLFSLERYEPNAVCTVFAGEALLDAWEKFGWDHCRDAAESAARYLRTNLNVIKTDHGSCFSYTELDKGITHNVNLMICAFLYRAAQVLKQADLSDGVEEFVRFALYSQYEDGSWRYGEEKGHNWIDGIHQGFCLLSLRQTAEFAPALKAVIEKALDKGFGYYLDSLITPQGWVRYYSHNLYPLDIHNFATAIIVLSRLKNRNPRTPEILTKLVSECLRLFWLENRGRFAYQIRRLAGRVRTPCIRWGQSWMLLALAEYLCEK
jgi:hypothetical protein